MFIGELALDGSLRHINGVLPIVSSLAKIFPTIILPDINKDEATLVKKIQIMPAANLKELIAYFKNEKPLPTYYKKFKIQAPKNYEFDFAYIKGQEQAKRALEIAAAGNHNVLRVWTQNLSLSL